MKDYLVDKGAEALLDDPDFRESCMQMEKIVHTYLWLVGSGSCSLLTNATKQLIGRFYYSIIDTMNDQESASTIIKQRPSNLFL